MRQSASRIRSLANRYALAEAAAFPGIGTERDRLSQQPEARCRIPAQLSALRPSSVTSTARGLANSIRALVFSRRLKPRYASQEGLYAI